MGMLGVALGSNMILETVDYYRNYYEPPLWISALGIKEDRELFVIDYIEAGSKFSLKRFKMIYETWGIKFTAVYLN